MWFIIDDQMADDRRIRRLPLATVGLWVKLCVIHSKGVSMQAKDPAAYPGYFDKLDLKDAGGTMKQLQQLIDSGLMEEHDGGWRPVGAKGRKTETEARSLYAAIAGNPVELGRLQTALRRYKRAVNDGQIRSGHIPRLNTWLRDQWKTWAPEPISPPPIHKHTWNCEHVHQLMDPHEDEYDHTGSLREGKPSKWYLACQACADELNNQQETSKEKQ